MKKLYFLLFSIITFNSFSQGTINFDDSTKWTQGTLAFGSYSNHSYTDGVFTASCVDVIRNGIAAQDGFAGGFGTFSLRLQNDATTEVNIAIASGGVGNFSFKARRWDGTPAVDFNVEYSTNGGANWTVSSVINSTITTDSDWKTILGTINSANTNVLIKIKANTAGERLMIDDFSWTSPSTDPSIIISSPSNGTVFNPNTSNVNVVLSINNFNVANGTGNGHIHYTINGGSAIMKYDTTPIVVPTTPGAYTVYVELVDNAHTPIVPAKNATIAFTVANLNVVTDLAALRADVIANGVGKYYQVSSTPVITYARTTRNQKYIQDATAGILIDDLSGTISTPMIAGDAISGLKGQASLFSGVLQLLPLENASVASSGNTITPQVVTAANIAASIETYESELVQINNASFTTADGTIVFATNTNYNLNDSSDITFRAMFSEANYIGGIVPSGAANRVVLVAEFNGTAQVVSRSLADTNLSVSQNSISGLKVYPNPVKDGNLYITSDSSEAKAISVYDILGKQVLNAKTLNNAVNVSNLKGGAYIVKITEDGKTDTRKLIIE